MSLCQLECVLILPCLCPYAIICVSSCLHACVLMFQCVCPHAFMRVLIHLTLRSVSHNKAINELRNLGLYPVNTQATPIYPTYNNYVSILHSYCLDLQLRDRGVQQTSRNGQTSTPLRFLCDTRIQKYDSVMCRSMCVLKLDMMCPYAFALMYMSSCFIAHVLMLSFTSSQT